MTTGSVSLSAFNTRQYVSVAIESPYAHDARNPNFVLGQASSLLDHVKPHTNTGPTGPDLAQPTQPTTETKNAAPQAPDTNDQSSAAKNTAKASLNVQINAPLTSATKAAITDATAASNNTAAVAAAPAVHAAPHAQPPAQINTSNSNDFSNTDSNTDTQAPPPTAHAAAADTAPAPQQATPVVSQGNVVQTGVYSSVESTTASTIRGTGVNVVS